MKNFVKVSVFLSFLFLCLSLSFDLSTLSFEINDADAATISSMFTTTEGSGNQILGRLCSALNGYMGWMIILFGGVLGAWEYFVQRQGHLLVAIVIGCVAIIFLGKILKVVAKNDSTIDCS